MNYSFTITEPFKIWFTSDLHFGHTKEFLYGPRGYNSADEMMMDVIKKWNAKVQPEDHVFILGDVLVGEEEPVGLIGLRHLNGKIHIIIGNHDTDRRISLYNDCDNVVEVLPAARFRYGKFHFWLSHYPTICDNYDDGDKLYQKVINLCGHSHTQDPFKDWGKGTIFHCELDAHNNEPILIDDIIDMMKAKF